MTIFETLRAHEIINEKRRHIAWPSMNISAVQPRLIYPISVRSSIPFPPPAILVLSYLSYSSGQQTNSLNAQFLLDIAM